MEPTKSLINTVSTAADARQEVIVVANEAAVVKWDT
jgi:hypothetical protein